MHSADGRAVASSTSRTQGKAVPSRTALIRGLSGKGQWRGNRQPKQQPQTGNRQPATALHAPARTRTQNSGIGIL